MCVCVCVCTDPPCWWEVQFPLDSVYPSGSLAWGRPPPPSRTEWHFLPYLCLRPTDTQVARAALQQQPLDTVLEGRGSVQSWLQNQHCIYFILFILFFIRYKNKSDSEMFFKCSLYNSKISQAVNQSALDLWYFKTDTKQYICIFVYQSNIPAQHLYLTSTVVLPVYHQRLNS